MWQKFLDDYSRFEDWLKTSERTAALPNSSGVLYTVAKEELKKFEVQYVHIGGCNVFIHACFAVLKVACQTSMCKQCQC